MPDTARHRTSYPSRFQPYAIEDDLPFALACGWSPPEAAVELHYHDLLEVGICRSGSGVLIAGDELLHYKQGDVCLIRPSDRHFHVCSHGVRACWDFIFFDPARALASCNVPSAILDTKILARPLIEAILDRTHYPGLGQTVDAMVAELRRRAPYCRDIVTALAVVLLATIHRHERANPAPARLPVRMTPRLMPVVEFASKHYAEKLTVGDLCALCGVNVRTLHRLWQAAFGQSPKEYLIRLRVAMVCSTLAVTDRSVTDIAFESGFQSLSNFNRQFRRIAGCSPRAWRREHGSSRT